jgi:hypothetical protein
MSGEGWCEGVYRNGKESNYCHGIAAGDYFDFYEEFFVSL